MFSSLFYAFICGSLLVGAIHINGNLADRTGPVYASAIVHFVGSIFGFLLLILKKDFRLIRQSIPKWSYCAGLLGNFIVIIHSYIFNKYLSITSILSLVLLGQVLTSMLIDHYGLIGLKKRTLKLNDFLQLIFIISGCFLILW